MMFAGDYIFGYLQSPYPNWYLYMKNNRIQVGIALFFGINLISGWIVSTGAFEVIYNGSVLYSGLQTGNLPAVEEIVQLVGSSI